MVNRNGAILTLVLLGFSVLELSCSSQEYTSGENSNFKQLSSALQDACAQPHNANFQGAWIHKNASGQITFAQNRQGNPLNCDTKFKIGSVSKTFTALMVLRLDEQGYLQIDHKVSQYLPAGFAISQSRLTLRQLMNHTSGITVNIERDPQLMGLTDYNQVKDGVMRVALQGAANPGTYRYNSVNYLLLAFIAQEVSGASNYEQALQQIILNPAGMVRTGIRNMESDGNFAYINQGPRPTSLIFASGAGGIYTTAADLFRLAEALEHQSLISSSTLNYMIEHSLGFEGVGQTAWHGGAIDGNTAMFEIGRGQSSMFAGFALGGVRARDIKRLAGVQ